MSARLEPNELGAAGALLSAVEGLFRAVRGQDDRFGDAHRSLALALDRLAMTSHTIPKGHHGNGEDPAPPFDRRRWEKEIDARLPKLRAYNAVEPLAAPPGAGQVTVGDGREDLLAILEDLERFAYLAGRDQFDLALFDLETHRLHWMRHVRDLQKLLEGA